MVGRGIISSPTPFLDEPLPAGVNCPLSGFSGPAFKETAVAKNQPAPPKFTKEQLREGIPIPRFSTEGTPAAVEQGFKNYLKQTIDLGRRLGGIALNGGGIDYDRLLIRHGRMYRGRVLSGSIAACKKWAKSTKPKIKDCYCNAASFALDHEQAIYFEGYYLDALMPILHAWNLVDGKIVDFTMEAADKTRKGKANLTSLYFGVEIPTAFVSKQIARTEEYAPIADLYLRQLEGRRKRKPKA